MILLRMATVDPVECGDDNQIAWMSAEEIQQPNGLWLVLLHKILLIEGNAVGGGLGGAWRS